MVRKVPRLPKKIFVLSKSDLKFPSLEELGKKAKSGSLDDFIVSLKEVWNNKLYSYEELVSVINQGNKEETPECKGSLKSDPRICSFLLHQDFEPRPTPKQKSHDNGISFNRYILDNSDCIKTEESFALCKQSYCYLREQDCIGKVLRDYANFQEDEL